MVDPPTSRLATKHGRWRAAAGYGSACVDRIRNIVDFLSRRDLLRTFSTFWIRITPIAFIVIAILRRRPIVLLALVFALGVVAFVYLTSGGPIAGVERQTLFFGGPLDVMFVAICLLFIRARSGSSRFCALSGTTANLLF